MWTRFFEFKQCLSCQPRSTISDHPKQSPRFLCRLRRPHSGARHSESDPVLIQVLKDNLKDNLESLEGTATVTVMKFGDPQITEERSNLSLDIGRAPLILTRDIYHASSILESGIFTDSTHDICIFSSNPFLE